MQQAGPPEIPPPQVPPPPPPRLEEAPPNNDQLERQIRELLEGQEALRQEVGRVREQASANYQELTEARREFQDQLRAAQDRVHQAPPPQATDYGPPPPSYGAPTPTNFYNNGHDDEYGPAPTMDGGYNQPYPGSGTFPESPFDGGGPPLDTQQQFGQGPPQGTQRSIGNLGPMSPAPPPPGSTIGTVDGQGPDPLASRRQLPPAASDARVATNLGYGGISAGLFNTISGHVANAKDGGLFNSISGHVATAKEKLGLGGSPAPERPKSTLF